MSDIAEMLEGITKPAEYFEGDYRGPDGLLYCGKCREPKETFVDLSDNGDGSEQKRVRVNCRCQDQALCAENSKKSRDQFAQYIEQLLRTFNISEPSYSRYTFATDDSPNTKISVTCRRYVDRWEKVKAENIGLLFYGSVGVIMLVPL